MTKILLRRDTAAVWAADDPILGPGELGVELDTHQLKIGDGATHWSSLPYLAPPGSAGVVSVAGKTGSVTLAAADIASGVFSTARIPDLSGSYVALGGDTWLKAQALAPAFVLSGSQVYDATSGTLTGSNIAWPDGTAGVYATTSLDANGAVLGFTATYVGATTRTVTVTIPRNGSSQVSGAMTATVA